MDSDLRHLRPVGIAGWTAFVLLFGAQLFMQTGGTPEPDFDAPLAEIQAYSSSPRGCCEPVIGAQLRRRSTRLCPSSGRPDAP
jgi:hypothetical protein